MTIRSKTIKSNAEGQGTKLQNCFLKMHFFHIAFTFWKYIVSHFKNNAFLKHNFSNFSFKLLQPFCSSAGLDNHKRHACHAKHRWMSPSATLATQSASGCRQVPRLPRQTKVDVAKCHACRAKCCAECHMRHACHTKRRRMSPSARPATQSAGGCRQARCLPRKVPQRPDDRRAPRAPPDPAQCHKRHACHAKHRWMSPSATLATQSASGCRQVPRLPRQTKVDVAKCHACRAKCCAECHMRHACHTKRRRMSPSARPATQSAGGCRQARRLPRKVPQRPDDRRAPRAPPDPAQCHKCHACHAKHRWMSPSARPATKSAGGCRQVRRLPRKVQRRPRDLKRATRRSPVP